MLEIGYNTTCVFKKIIQIPGGIMIYKTFFKEFLIINFGFFICAFGIVNFMVPAKLAAGGITGLSTILHYVINYPVGTIMLVFNIPIFIIGALTIGKEYAIKCLYGIFLFPFYTRMIEKFLVFPSITSYSESNILIGAIFSGVLIGAGVGFAVAAGSNTGGSVIIAQVMNKYTLVPVGTCMFIIDSLVVGSSALVFGINAALTAIICPFIMGKMVNVITKRVVISR